MNTIFIKKSIQENIYSVLFVQGNLALAERDEAEQKAERWQYGKVAVDALGKALSTQGKKKIQIPVKPVYNNLSRKENVVPKQQHAKQP